MGLVTYNIRQAAEVLGIGRTKMYQLVSAGVIKSKRIGRCIRISEDWLREYLERDDTPATTKPRRTAKQR